MPFSCGRIGMAADLRRHRRSGLCSGPRLEYPQGQPGLREFSLLPERIDLRAFQRASSSVFAEGGSFWTRSKMGSRSARNTWSRHRKNPPGLFFPLFFFLGEYSGSVQIIEDVTERKEKEMRLVMTERLAPWGRWLGISHEILNPMATIGACAEGLLSRLEKARWT